MVLRVCRATAGPDLAEDAWSETFLAALRAYPELPDGSNIAAWLATIAHRKALDQRRAQTRRAVPVADIPEPVHGAAAPGLAMTQPGLEGGWEVELWSALAELPDKQRQTVIYHHIGGLPYAAIADILGGTAAAARRAAADGIARLRLVYLAP